MTISSQVQVFNLALNAVGARDNISSPSEASREAEVCNLWYSPVRDQVLASAAWPEATVFAYLQELAQADEDDDGVWAVGDPAPGYTYVYGVPNDLLRPIYQTDFAPFRIANYSNNQRALHSNTAQAILAYTTRLETIALWGPELQMAIVMGLAAYICMPLTGKPSRARSLEAKANQTILAARETAANASNETFDWVPDWIAARGYNNPSSNRYYHPYGALLSVS